MAVTEDAARHRALSRALAVPLGGLALCSGYLGLLTVAGLRAARRGADRTSTSATARHRFVVLVPAHDEERLIGACVDSITALDHPPSHVAVHVVADNCSDATAAVAACHGARVHERHAPDDPGKGPALNWLLRRLQQDGEPYDAVVIIDADSLVAPSFLRVMDARLAAGDRVVQAHYTVRDPGGGWLVGLRTAALAVRHYLRPLARTSYGGSAGLYGNGMVFAADVLREGSWSGHLTEDIELEAQLLLEGGRIGFAPDAVVAAEMPIGLRATRSQNERWECGRLQVIRRYVPRLLRAGLVDGRRRLACIDAAADHLVPPLSVQHAAGAVAAAAAGALWMGRATGLSRTNAAVALTVLAAQAAYLAAGLRLTRAPASVWWALLRAPLYVAWKVGLYLRSALLRGPETWIRTTRNTP